MPELTAKRAVADAGVVYEIITETPAVALGERWPALHFALCAEAPMPRHAALSEGIEWDDGTLENVLMGGDATPYADGLTVARCVQPATVRVLAAKLTALPPDKIWDDIDEGIDEYLPSEWPDPLKRSTIAAMYMRVVDVYRAAASASDGILIYVP